MYCCDAKATKTTSSASNEADLSLRLKRSRRHKAAKLRQPKQLAFAINEIWSMDLSLTRCSTTASCACSRWSTATRGNAWQ